MAAFKTDESFLEKISIGAIGTKQVFSTLTTQGHHPIELERGSMSYKIWKKIKIKRIRVPDILCVNNGIRIESRAKTKLEISMSHSTSDPSRGWDYEMKDNDYIALVVCRKSGDQPIDWTSENLVQFISIKDLRDAQNLNKITFIKAKGSQEGFEVRINWPSGIASSDGTITEISETAIKYKTSSGRTNFVRLNKGGKALFPIVKVGDTISTNQIIASVVNVQKTIPNQKIDVKFFLKNLSSSALGDRYTAAKALCYFNESEIISALISRISDPNEHIYIKLEAAASLARLNMQEGYDFIKNCLTDSYLQNVLEAVIILAEIKTDQACNMLCDILENDSLDSEIRAGAAYGLGEQQNKIALTKIIYSFNSIEKNIKIEAARALAKLTKKFSNDVVQKFALSSASEKPGIAWALTKAESLNIEQITQDLKDVDSRHWASFIFGMRNQEQYISEIEKLRNKDPEVYFAVTLLWKIATSWIQNLKEY